MRDHVVTWQKILAQGFTSSTELLQFLSLPPTLSSKIAEKKFKTRVPRSFAGRMQPGNPNDPLLLQVLATEAEAAEAAGFCVDPLAESLSLRQPGLLHKYHGRILLTITGVCAINCRYCFRRHFPYHANNPGVAGWQQALDYVKADPSIFEVILSGGDPLLATNYVLGELIVQLSMIEHVQILRIHTRVPIVLPERIDTDLLRILKASRLIKVINLHSNHAQELDTSVFAACAALRSHDCQLLNQSVLLKGINDDVNILIELSKQLLYCGILPYYLHVLDRVQGSQHFDLAEEKALALYRELQTKLPGYLLPRLAKEVPGKANKIIMV